MEFFRNILPAPDAEPVERPPEILPLESFSDAEGVGACNDFPSLPQECRPVEIKLFLGSLTNKARKKVDSR